jgi:hypothetical protein
MAEKIGPFYYLLSCVCFFCPLSKRESALDAGKTTAMFIYLFNFWLILPRAYFHEKIVEYICLLFVRRVFPPSLSFLFA